MAPQSVHIDVKIDDFFRKAIVPGLLLEKLKIPAGSAAAEAWLAKYYANQSFSCSKKTEYELQQITDNLSAIRSLCNGQQGTRQLKFNSRTIRTLLHAAYLKSNRKDEEYGQRKRGGNSGRPSKISTTVKFHAPRVLARPEHGTDSELIVEAFIAWLTFLFNTPSIKLAWSEETGVSLSFEPTTYTSGMHLLLLYYRIDLTSYALTCNHHLFYPPNNADSFSTHIDLKNLSAWLPEAVYNHIVLHGDPVDHDAFKTSARSAISVQYKNSDGIPVTIRTDFCGPASLINACCSGSCMSVNLPSWNTDDWKHEGIPPRIQQVDGIALIPNSSILTYYAYDYFDDAPTTFKCGKCGSTSVKELSC